MPQARPGTYDVPMNESLPDGAELELYRLTFEHVPDAIFIVDLQGAVVLSNAAAHRLPPEVVARLVGRSEAALEIDLLHRQVRALGAARAETGLGGRVFSVEARMHRDGQILIVREITERRRQEAELRALHRVESMGHFTASLVHDFNNLLTPIACLSGSLELDLPAGREREMASDLRGAAEKAAALARQTLMWVRRELPRAELVDPAVVLAELRSVLERVVGSEVRVELAVAAPCGAVSLDRERLEHALLNLAANARDAMPIGGTLILSAAKVVLEEGQRDLLGDARGGAYVSVAVTDSGVGMKSEVREQIFRPFFTTKESGKGTGLGLDAVRRFVAESGGCIAVRSEEGRGTTVSMYFPVVALAPPAAAAPRDADPTGTETVLVVDDDDRVRRGLRAVLQSRGYEVLEATNAERALEIVQDPGATVDLALVDVVLQEASGVELARRMQTVRPTRVLFTSGHTEQRLERCGWVAADGPLLRKAFTPAELLRAVRDALGAPRG